MAEKGGYPADLGKLREYLLKVANAKLVEKKTAKTERYPDLGLSDISDPKAKGTAIDIDGLAAGGADDGDGQGCEQLRDVHRLWHGDLSEVMTVFHIHVLAFRSC